MNSRDSIGLNIRIVENGFVIYSRPENGGKDYVAKTIDETLEHVRAILEGSETQASKDERGAA